MVRAVAKNTANFFKIIFEFDKNCKVLHLRPTHTRQDKYTVISIIDLHMWMCAKRNNKHMLLVITKTKGKISYQNKLNKTPLKKTVAWSIDQAGHPD